MNHLILLFMAIVANVTLTIKSPAFQDNGNIPSRYTCEGKNINPELNIRNLPDNAKSMALIVDDPDAPGGPFVHWVMWNIPPGETIGENTSLGTEGKNGKNENKYAGPCPPTGKHHYHFRVYALDVKLDLPEGTDKQTLLKAMDGHILASGDLVGLYQKMKSNKK
jgi:Raf kinase inhibitor-like YbhB/YbcL family protein